MNTRQGGYATGATWFPSAEQNDTGLTPWSASNGVLNLTAYDHASNGKPVTSGHLDTQGTFSQTYGYFEVRAEMPATGTVADGGTDGGQGGGGAFWLLDQNGSWPPELDVIEGTNWGGIYTTHTGVGGHSAQSSWSNIPDIGSAYHTYGVDWEADQTKWYVDGKQVFQADTPSDMHDPMYMLLNLYGNEGGGSGDSTMHVDYVRVYAEGASASTTAAGTSTLAAAPAANVVPVSTASADTSTHISTTAAGTGVNKIVQGGSGSDALDGGAGDDIISGGAGDDQITGGVGDDNLAGEAGNDLISGGDGNDGLDGGVGNDRLNGDSGNDALQGGEGNDILNGGQGNDLLVGSAGDDILNGDSGNDVLQGGVGIDQLFGGSGNDVLTGGAGSDTFVFDAQQGNDIITDFSGADRLLFTGGVFSSTAQAQAAVSPNRVGEADGLANDVRVDLGGGNGVTLLNTTVTANQIFVA